MQVPVPGFQQILSFFFGGGSTLTIPAIFGPLQALLVQFLQSTPLSLTADDPVVIAAWKAMLALANAFFALLVLVGIIQMMLTRGTGSLSISATEFVPRVLSTALLMNLSYVLGRSLLALNNLLCAQITVNLTTFFNRLNGPVRGSASNPQLVLLDLAIIVLLNLGIIRIILQAFERIVLWILLFVLFPLVSMLRFLPATEGVFLFWLRMFTVVTFTQFVQYLAFALGVQFWASASAGTDALTRYLIAIAMLWLVARIPSLLSRFPSMALPVAGGVGRVVGAFLLAARLLA